MLFVKRSKLIKLNAFNMRGASHLYNEEKNWRVRMKLAYLQHLERFQLLRHQNLRRRPFVNENWSSDTLLYVGLNECNECFRYKRKNNTARLIYCWSQYPNNKAKYLKPNWRVGIFWRSQNLFLVQPSKKCISFVFILSWELGFVAGWEYKRHKIKREKLTTAWMSDVRYAPYTKFCILFTVRSPVLFSQFNSAALRISRETNPPSKNENWFVSLASTFDFHHADFYKFADSRHKKTPVK